MVFDEYMELIILENIYEIGKAKILDGKVKGLAIDCKAYRPFCKCKNNGYCAVSCSKNLSQK